MSTLSPNLTSSVGLFDRLCDDAAIFPPGNLPLAQAVPAHLHHRFSAHRDLVGPFVVAQAELGALGPVLAGVGAGSDSGNALQLAVTTPLGQLEGTLLSASSLPGTRLAAVEVALDSAARPRDALSRVRHALADVDGVDVYVEIPRDERAADLFAELAGTAIAAKFRTGGIRADLYPDEAELAGVLVAAVAAGVPFKATAGLHHAVRNTDPTTGFEQHGFLNVLAATDAAMSGAERGEVAVVLAQRDASALADTVSRTDPQARTMFRSFGTCSIDEPVQELRLLGLLPDDLTQETL